MAFLGLFLASLTIVAFVLLSHEAWLMIAIASANLIVFAVFEFFRPVRHRILVPQELPPQIGRFVGRQTELDELETVLRDQARQGPLIVVLWGEAGVGKTALALALADRLQDCYPDGRLFESLEGRSAEDILGDMVGALKGPRDVVSRDRTVAWRKISAKRRFFVILDDAGAADTVSELLPRQGRGAVVITSKNPLKSISANHRMQLETMTEADAHDLLCTMVGAARATGKHEAAAAEIVCLTGRLPLALRLTGTVLASRPQWTLEFALKRVRTLKQLPSGAPRTLDVCYAMIGESEREALRLLARLPTNEFSPWHIEAMCKITEEGAWQIADRLSRAGLVERTTEDLTGVPTFRMLDHVRGYAKARLVLETPPDVQDRANERLERLEQDRSHDLLRLLHDRVYSNFETGNLFEALTGARDVLAIARLGNPPGLGSDERWEEMPRPRRRAAGLALAAMAEIQAELGSITESRDLARSALRSNEPDVIPRALRCLGTLEFMRSATERARQILERSLSAAEKIEDGAEQVRVLRRLAVAQAHDGDFSSADASIKKARYLCEQRKDRGTRLVVGVDYADAVVHTLREGWDEAADLLEQAKARAADHDLMLWQGWIAHQRALVSLLSGKDLEEARRNALAGIDVFTELGHRYGAAHCRLLCGQVLLKMARPVTALPYLEEALSTFVTCRDLVGNARAAMALAEVRQVQGDNDEARRHLQMAVRSLETSGDWEGSNRANGLLRNLRWRISPNWAADPLKVVRSAGPGQ